MSSVGCLKYGERVLLYLTPTDGFERTARISLIAFLVSLRPVLYETVTVKSY